MAIVVVVVVVVVVNKEKLASGSSCRWTLAW